jgi:asparagine synthase (glutamine-hydrolysing)
MLTKVDLMSMANSLEVRVPFLDVEVVNYAFRLPADYKITKTAQKRILRDSFGKLLPLKFSKDQSKDLKFHLQIGSEEV